MATKEDEKQLNVRINKQLWNFLRKKSFDRESSMTKIITELLEKYKKTCENRLTEKASTL